MCWVTIPISHRLKMKWWFNTSKGCQARERWAEESKFLIKEEIMFAVLYFFSFIILLYFVWFHFTPPRVNLELVGA